MRKLAGIFAVLLAFLFAGLMSAPALAAEKRATLRFINPEIFLNGMRIKRIVVTVDGFDFGSCEADQRQPGNVCIKPRPISPGPHIIEILLDPLTSSYFQAVDKFSAGMTGEWTFDIKGLANDNAKTDDFLTVFQGLSPVEGCPAALVRIASMSSCTLAELGALAPAFAAATNACARDVPDKDKDAASAAFSEIVDIHFRLPMERCFTRAEIKKFPASITAFSRPYDGWPLDQGSWRWARDAEPDLSGSDHLADALDILQAALPEMAKRFAVVDGVTSAYVSGDTAAVRQAAMSAPFSLDGTTPEGHRNLLLLADPGHFYDAKYADFVASKVAANDELDCARSDWETRLLVTYFIEKGKLSAPAYNALLALAKRVPADLGYGACSKAIDLSLESAVAPAERLRPFFALDCADTRTPERRGSTLKSFLEGDPRADNAMQKQMRQEFAACLAATKQVATAAATSSALADAAQRGCKIGPNATCSKVTLRRADLHGADLRGAKLDEATLEEANLNGANFSGADLHWANFDKADLTGADLTGANLENAYARKTDLHGVKFAGTGSMHAANLVESDLHGADLSGVMLREARFSSANLEGANLMGADLSQARFERANLRGADLRKAKLDGATLRDADLTGAKLDGASLHGVNLRGANLKDAVLAGADLAKSPLEEVTWVNGCKLVPQTKCPGADLHGMSLVRVDLRGADLSGANLQNADLESTWLEGADLHGADLRNANVAQTIMRDANLAGANLEGSHGGDTQFLGANMSETILRDGKKCGPGAKAERIRDC